MIQQEFRCDLTSLKNSFEINKKLQVLLQDEISRVRYLLSQNRETQVALKSITDKYTQNEYEERISRIRDPVKFAAPYFQDVRKMHPPPNEDTIVKRKSHDIDAFLRPPRPWSPEEYKTLSDSVFVYALSSVLELLNKERCHIKEKMKNKMLKEEDIDDLEDDLYIVEQKMRLARRKSPDELVKLMNGKIDWMTISATNMKGFRTPEECECMWNNYLSSDINKETFRRIEDRMLIDLVEDNNGKNWDKIAASLKTNRSAIQCLQRYQKLRPKVEIKYWTREEDQQLIALIEEYKRNDIIPWNKISLEMPGRTRRQIKYRYERIKPQNCVYGSFSPEEDALLIALHQKYGPDWKKIKGYFKRSAEQVKERYLNVLDPGMKCGPWTPDEDRRLITMIRRHGYGKWKKISQDVPGRDDHKCLVRAKRLLKWSIDYHYKKGKDINLDEHDPKLIAKILKPIPKSDNLPQYDIKFERQRLHRENGLKVLVEALKKLVPEYVTKVPDLNAIDVSWMNSELFHKLTDLLHSSLPEMKKVEKMEPAPRVYLVNPPPRPKRVILQNNNEEEEEDDIQSLPEEEKISKKTMFLVHTALQKLFEIQSKVLHMPKNRMGKVYSAKDWTEITLYKEYLSKQFHCKSIDNEEVFDDVDFQKSFHNVIQYFIQPPVYENQFIVLAPNVSTMSGMEIIEATEDRLQSMSECVSHSTPYIDYLCKRRNSCPQCLHCLHRSNKVVSNPTPESVISQMEQKFFLVDDLLKDSAHVEAASIERLSHSCVCKALDDSKKSVQLLRKRFLSLYTWPALMSAVGFSEEQDNLFGKKLEDNNYSTNTSYMPPEKQKSREKYKETKNEVCHKKKAKEKPAFKLKSESESELETESESELETECVIENQEQYFTETKLEPKVKLQVSREMYNKTKKEESYRKQTDKKPKLEPKSESESELETDCVFESQKRYLTEAKIELKRDLQVSREKYNKMKRKGSLREQSDKKPKLEPKSESENESESEVGLQTESESELETECFTESQVSHEQYFTGGKLEPKVELQISNYKNQSETERKRRISLEQSNQEAKIRRTCSESERDLLKKLELGTDEKFK